MWADSKKIVFEFFTLFLCRLWRAYAIFQHRITFEPLIQFSNTKVFWNLPTVGYMLHLLIFNYLIF